MLLIIFKQVIQSDITLYHFRVFPMGDAFRGNQC